MSSIAPPRVEVINLGEELLMGLRDNAHLVFLGQCLLKRGVTIAEASIIGDGSEQIRTHFSAAWQRSDIIITTGGLGPTTDDNTRETIAKVLDLDLHHDDSVEKAIRDRFALMGRRVADMNLRQAKVPDGAEVMANPNGTAPGLWLKKDGKIVAMLPGPAQELRPMVQNELIPRLEREGLLREEQAYIQLRTIGVGESAAQERLMPVFEKYGERLGVAYCAHTGLVDIRLSTLDESALTFEQVERCVRECEEVLGEDIIGRGDCILAAEVIHQVRSLGKRLALAESCTGGLLANSFTDIPGASKVFAGGCVCYSNEAKISMIEVPESIIQQHGAVSSECAIAMAMGAAERFNADYALSVTGFAGPEGGTDEHPVGTVFIGYHSPVGTWARREVFPGSRSMVKQRAVNASLDFMRRKLKQHLLEDVMACLACEV